MNKRIIGEQKLLSKNFKIQQVKQSHRNLRKKINKEGGKLEVREIQRNSPKIQYLSNWSSRKRDQRSWEGGKLSKKQFLLTKGHASVN